eukprot:TRINITY_DN21744_c0_g1_i1.p1 TRINITY_DN21744_c0_g1~~TRINITY_DN21744_c0_g1_i1.p1  ORF type:complete len:563 (+),score=84.32 TRINITY_DN21744_c0_g1_i1:54-1742(+)
MYEVQPNDDFADSGSDIETYDQPEDTADDEIRAPPVGIVLGDGCVHTHASEKLAPFPCPLPIGTYVALSVKEGKIERYAAVAPPNESPALNELIRRGIAAPLPELQRRISYDEDPPGPMFTELKWSNPEHTGNHHAKGNTCKMVLRLMDTQAELQKWAQEEHVALRGQITLPKDPKLVVDTMELPLDKLTDEVMEALEKQCQPSALGVRGQGDRIDVQRRRSVETKAVSFGSARQLEHFLFPETLEEIRKILAPTAASVSAEFHKLVVYPPGGFFREHVDTQSSPNHFATIVLSLYGDLDRLRVCDKDAVLPLPTAQGFSLPFMAFLTSEPHEVIAAPERRAVITYHLHRNGQRRVPIPPLLLQTRADFEALYYGGPLGDRGIEGFCVLLRHTYGSAALRPELLKGSDRLVYDSLHGAFDLYLVQLTEEELEEPDGSTSTAGFKAILSRDVWVGPLIHVPTPYYADGELMTDQQAVRLHRLKHVMFFSLIGGRRTEHKAMQRSRWYGNRDGASEYWYERAALVALISVWRRRRGLAYALARRSSIFGLRRLEPVRHLIATFL